MTPFGEVWTYWEGACPPLIRLCLDSLERHASARVLDPISFDRLWISDRDLAIDELYVAHRADFVRAHLLRHYGGVWIDADCVLLRSLTALLEGIGGKDLGFFRQLVGGIANNFIAARGGAPIVVSYYQRIVEHLRARRPIHWTEIGTVPLTAAIEAFPDAAHELERAVIMPVCWSEAERLLVHQAAGAQQLEQRAYCYMLSNHSLPQLRSLSRSELVCAPNLLGAVLRGALSTEEPTMKHELKDDSSSNYAYWRQAGSEWGAEYERRKARHPYYHIAELMLLDYVTHHAPCNVLEWGCGTGRHLYNLAHVPGVDAYGFDQSSAMVDSGIGRSLPGFRRERVHVGEATGKLPYEDGSFDIVLTSEALLHTRPEDLKSRLSELLRVARGHVLHLEAPPAWIGGFSAWHDGCWGHDFVAAYRELGVDCEVLGSGFTRQVPYRAVLAADSVRWTWSDSMLELYRRLEASLEEGFRQANVPAYA